MSQPTVEFGAMVCRPSGLQIGVTIRGPEDSWVRFALLRLPWHQIDLKVLSEAQGHAQLAQSEPHQKERLF